MDDITTQGYLDVINTLTKELRMFAADAKLRPDYAAAMVQAADHLDDFIKEALAFCFLSTAALASEEVRDQVAEELAEINVKPKTVYEIRDATLKYLLDRGI